MTSFSEPFIRRPVATTLLTLGLALAGLLAFFKLPVAPLPQVEYPTISVTAQMPGASPETMATSVATPLERYLGAIADVTEITSSSTIGQSRITLQFGLNRSIDGAARDVQAAINAARIDLPASLRRNPTYRKVNPADAPVVLLALTSEVKSQGQIYDAATTILEQRLSQIEGVGQVNIGGSSLPAVRVELNPRALFKYGIGMEDVRAALAAANANAPKGAIEIDERRYQIYANDQATNAADYTNLVVAWRNGAAVRLRDIADVVDSVENLRNQGLANGKRSVLVLIYRQPGANIIETVERVKALLPQLQASIPSEVDVEVVADRTVTIRASLRAVEESLLIAIGLVAFVVFLFLRTGRATLIPSVAVPISLLGTFGAMYLLGYSLNNLSLMALVIATGFVVDDAIVVLENIARHIEAGRSRLDAALIGAREVGFTVVSMSLSLIAAFIPILLMGGIIGRLFREFAVTLAVAIVISLAVSLTTTPMMCAYMLRERRVREPWWSRVAERGFDAMVRGYARTLDWSLRNALFIVVVLFGVLALNVYLFTLVPKGFFPQQDTGRLAGGIQADQAVSHQLMRRKLTQYINIIKSDPAVQHAVGFTGGGQTNGGFVFVSLKPVKERDATADQVIARLRPQLARVPGARLFLQAVQDIRVGGRETFSQYQYTLQGDNLSELLAWGPKLAEALQGIPEIVDVNSDQQEKGLQLNLRIDRDTAARLGLTVSQVDNTLYDAFGQRQVSTIYTPLNQYHVVMEVAPDYWQDPQMLNEIYISTRGGAVSGSSATNAIASTTTTARGGTGGAADIAAENVRNLRANRLGNTGRGGASSGAAVSTTPGTMVPLSAFVTNEPGNTPLAVAHQGSFVATTISFNLPVNGVLGDAVKAIEQAMNRIGIPATVHGTFQGTARVFQQSLDNQPMLILVAILAVYIVLGILYESTIHPITILSTLPSAGVGAVLALVLYGIEFSIIALIGVILLIGIVKKNAIMMIDFAIDAQRRLGLDSREAIREACLLRFRPILMTTLAALFGAVPLALGAGDGAELRRPLGISIIGGLVLSQILTLYTTPVVYLYLDRLRAWCRRRSARQLA
jgi:multidrug efflux pump